MKKQRAKSARSSKGGQKFKPKNAFRKKGSDNNRRKAQSYDNKPQLPTSGNVVRSRPGGLDAYFQSILEKRWFEIKESEGSQRSREFKAASEKDLERQIREQGYKILSQLSSRGEEVQSQEESLSQHTERLGTAIKKCPLSSIECLKQLLKIATKSSTNRTATIFAINSLKSLFVEDLLPPGRKLSFLQNNVLITKKRCTVLTTWEVVQACFEDVLKGLFANFILALGVGSRDTVLQYRRVCLRCAYELLASCPEQETSTLAILCQSLVNSEDTAFAASQFRALLEQHPPMRPVVVEAVAAECKRRLANKRLPSVQSLQLLGGSGVGAVVEVLAVTLHECVEQLKEQCAKAKRPKLLRRRSKKGVGSQAKHQQEKAKGRSDYNGSIFKAVVTSLSKCLPKLNSIPESLSLDCECLDKLIDKIDSGSLQISLFNLLVRLSILLQKDTRGLTILLYSLMRNFNMGSSSNYMTLFQDIVPLLLKDELIKRDLNLAFWRRIIQVSIHITNIPQQIHALCHGWTALEIICDSPKNAMPNQVIFASDQHLLHLQKGEENKNQTLDPPEVQIVKYGYKEKGGDPRYARAECSNFWEVWLLASSISPSIAKTAQNLIGVLKEEEVKEESDFDINAVLTKRGKEKVKILDESQILSMLTTATTENFNQFEETSSVNKTELQFIKNYLESDSVQRKAKKPRSDEDSEAELDAALDDALFGRQKGSTALFDDSDYESLSELSESFSEDGS